MKKRQYGLIRNKGKLILNGVSAPNQRARQLCLQALEEALSAVNPYECMRSKVRVLDKQLSANGLFIPLSRFRKILLVAAGKASAPMMRAALDILKDQESPVHGILVAPKYQGLETLSNKVEVFHSSHPLPNREGLKASQRVIDAVGGMNEYDLLLCLISGGASAMLPAPPAGITLRDKRRAMEMLLKTNATSREITTVRRHLSKLKGGRLVELCRASTILSLIMSDNPGNHPWEIASGLTVEDPTSYKDAVEILKVHGLWRKLPPTVTHHLTMGLKGEIPETPKPGTTAFRRVHNLMIADNRAACVAAKGALTANRIQTTILTSSAVMEARSMGRLLASLAIECKSHRDLWPGPRALILGGETTVNVKGEGTGGRTQETALFAAEDVVNLKGIVIAALGTDGIDGNSRAAGAMVDGDTVLRAKRQRMNPLDFLARNDSYRFFERLSDCLVTGPTGTNVGDLYIAISME